MVDLIPRNVLFGNPERTAPRISPDGHSLAWIAPLDGVLNVWVAPIGGPGTGGGDSDDSDSGVDWAAARAVTSDADRGVRVFSWARDGRHLLYVQDTGGDENWRLYDVNLDTSQRRDLTPFDKIHATIIGTSKRRPTEVLVGINADNPQLHDVYRLNLVTGELVKEIENPGYAGWLADEDLVVRCAIAPLPDGSFDVLVRDASGAGPADADWRKLLTIPAEDATSTDVVSFSGDGRSVLMISAAGSDTGRLTRETVHAELGEIVCGARPGRERADETILLWHRGLSILDIAVAHLIMERAVAADTGTMLRYH